MSVNQPASKKPINKVTIALIAAGILLCLCVCVVASILAAVFVFNTKTSTVSPDGQNQGFDPTLNVPMVDSLESEPDPATQTWLVLFYLDADDPVLEEDMYFDLNEIEMAGSTDRIKLVAQMDRYEGGFSGDGDWTGTRRYLLTQDADLNAINSEMVADLGELDMGSSATLVDFATWAIQSYPADRYVLIMSDHGSGWPGGWTDDNPKSSDGNWLHLQDLEAGLAQIKSNTGVDQFELIGMDACLMSMLEVYNSLAPYAHYAVASQETEPSLGWAYASFLDKLVSDPGMNGADLSRAIVSGYINQDQRILNDAARQRMLTGFGFSDDAGAESVAQDFGTDITLAAVNLQSLPQLNDSVNSLLVGMKAVDQQKVAEARSYAQSFLNVFGDQYPSPYIDLLNFANLVAESSGDADVKQSALQLREALGQTVIAEMHGARRAGASGISIYFPVSDLYWNDDFGYLGYARASENFTSGTLWDDFLAYHYAGQDFGLGIPSRDARIPAPGAAQVIIAPLTLSTASINSGDTVNIQTDISGDQIAYINLVGMIKHDNRYLAYFIDYVQGKNNLIQDGVNYPGWERQNGKIHIVLDWNLAMDGVCADEVCAFALLNPDLYTPKPEDLQYFTEGWYTFGKTGERIEATLYFDNYGENQIRNIVGHTGAAGSVSIPSQITPKPGDKFTFLDTWWDVDSKGNITDSYQEGNALTFGNKPFSWGSKLPQAGEYSIGIMVEDMDGNLTFQFAPVTVSP